jgi:hypothetical protein
MVSRAKIKNILEPTEMAAIENMVLGVTKVDETYIGTKKGPRLDSINQQ